MPQPATSARFDRKVRFVTPVKVPIQEIGRRGPSSAAPWGTQAGTRVRRVVCVYCDYHSLFPVTLTVAGARYPRLLPVGAIPAPVQGYLVAFGRGRARH